MKPLYITAGQRAELKALAAMSDEDIDISDIPEIREFAHPRRGMFSGSPNRRAVPKQEQASVKVDVRGLDAETHQYGAHDVETCALCAAYKRGFGEGRRKGFREQSDRFKGAMNRLLDRT